MSRDQEQKLITVVGLVSRSSPKENLMQFARVFFASQYLLASLATTALGGTVSLLPTDDATAEGASFDAGGEELTVGGGDGVSTRRFALEFDLSSLSSVSTVTSADLVLDGVGSAVFATTLPTSMQFSVHSYAGDGAVTLADVDLDNFAAGPFSFSYDGNSLTPSSFSILTIDVTAALNTLLASNANYAGFAVRPDSLPTDGIIRWGFASADTGLSLATRPTLNATFASAPEVPEPSSAALWGICVFGLIAGLMRRRRRTRASRLCA